MIARLTKNPTASTLDLSAARARLPELEAAIEGAERIHAEWSNLPGALAAARRALDEAEAAQADAEGDAEARQAIGKPADPAALDRARAATEAARMALDKAERRRDVLRRAAAMAGPELAEIAVELSCDLTDATGDLLASIDDERARLISRLTEIEALRMALTGSFAREVEITARAIAAFVPTGTSAEIIASIAPIRTAIRRAERIGDRLAAIAN